MAFVQIGRVELYLGRIKLNLNNFQIWISIGFGIF